MVACAEAALALGEPLAGTAGQARELLVLEWRGRWESDTLGALPQAVRAHLEGWLACRPAAKVLLARHPDRREGPVRVALWSAEDTGRLARADLDAVEEVTHLDLARGDGLAVTDEPLVLVCAHGRRDRCCARLGTPVFEALDRALGGGVVWQSSHQGGHRFAANVLVLPAGIQLGRVRPEHAAAVADAVRRRAVPVGHLRGRIAFSPAAQAAERAVRERLGLAELDAVTPLGRDGEGEVFATPLGRVLVAVREAEGPALPLSCGTAPEPTRVLEAEVVRIEPVGGTG